MARRRLAGQVWVPSLHHRLWREFRPPKLRGGIVPDKTFSLDHAKLQRGTPQICGGVFSLSSPSSVGTDTPPSESVLSSRVMSHQRPETTSNSEKRTPAALVIHTPNRNEIREYAQESRDLSDPDTKINKIPQRQQKPKTDLH